VGQSILALKDRYKTGDKLTAFGAIDFNCFTQIQDNLFILSFFCYGDWPGIQTLETQAFVAICDRLLLALYLCLNP